MDKGRSFDSQTARTSLKGSTSTYVADVHSDQSRKNPSTNQQASTFASVTGLDDELTSTEAIDSMNMPSIPSDRAYHSSNAKTLMAVGAAEQCDSGFCSTSFVSGDISLLHSVERVPSTETPTLTTTTTSTTTTSRNTTCLNEEEGQLLATSSVDPELEPLQSVSGPFPCRLNHPDSTLRKAFSQDEDGDTDLHIAVVHENLELVEWLVALARHHRMPHLVDLQNDMSQSALHLACVMGSEAVVRMLVRAGADPGISDRRGDTCFHLAVDQTRTSCRRRALLRLLASGVSAGRRAKLDAVNYEGLTPLHVAAQDGCAGALEELLSLGADPNIQDGCGFRSALYIAVGNKYRKAVAALVRHADTDVNLPSGSGLTPLDLARLHGHRGLEELLRAAGARPLEDRPHTAEDSSDVSISDAEDEVDGMLAAAVHCFTLDDDSD